MGHNGFLEKYTNVYKNFLYYHQTIRKYRAFRKIQVYEFSSAVLHTR